jgi:3-hydroxyisobutyrate dehydrogenase-like beta-hydroxyacid dehydrogenase
MKVHVVGAGKMGLPMARPPAQGRPRRHVPTTGRRRGWRWRAKPAWASQGAQGLDAADVVLSSLPHDARCWPSASRWPATRPRRRLHRHQHGLAGGVGAGRAGLQQAGVQYLRTTVSGNNKMAEAAQLTVMASGPRATYDAMLPLLQLLGPKQFWLGEGEQARLMKLVVNLMIAQTSAMLAEALALGRKGGLRWEDLWAVLGASAVGSPIVKAKSVQLVQRDFTPTFTVEQMVKDLGLILEAAAASHVPVPQTAATLQLMHAAIAQGDGGDDYAAIIKAVERAAGLAGEP